MGSTCVGGTCLATNLVTNGDFETGDFTGWTLTDCYPGWTYVGTQARYSVGPVVGSEHGNYFAETICYYAGPPTLQQTITGLSVGQTYTMTAYYNGFGNGTPDSVTFYVDGIQIASRTNQGSADGWFLVTGSFTASAASAVFSFKFASDPGSPGVDNIVIM